MAVRGTKPVLQFRGIARAYFVHLEHYCDVLLRYDTKKGGQIILTNLERDKVTAVLLLCSQKLAHRVNV